MLCLQAAAQTATEIRQVCFRKVSISHYDCFYKVVSMRESMMCYNQALRKEKNYSHSAIDEKALLVYILYLDKRGIQSVLVDKDATARDC